MSDKMKNLLIRTASGAVLIAIFAGAVWSRWSFGALLLAIMIGCSAEFYRLCNKGGIRPQKVAGMICNIVLFVLGFILLAIFDGSTGSVPQYAAGMIFPLALYFTVMLPLIFICELWHRSGTPIANIATTVAGVVYVAVPMSMLLFIPSMLSGERWSEAMLGFMAIVWGNDVFAYLAGSTFGRHKMAERISPKKSWEGFAGGIAGAVLIGWAMSLLLDGSIAVWCGLAAVTAVTGIAGDLVESMFKRSVGVKDSGSIMPGHGGWLDRFDALLIATPFAFVYLLLVL